MSTVFVVIYDWWRYEPTFCLGPGPFTVMAPSNEAFNHLPPNVLKYLLDPNNKADLVRVLTYHVIGSKILAADLTNGEELLTLEGGHERVTIYNKQILINFAEVTHADNLASNGELPAARVQHSAVLRVAHRCCSHHQPCSVSSSLGLTCPPVSVCGY
jgi:hypothetical protein